MVKKVLEVVASNERGRKFLLYVVGIALFLVMLPMIVITGMFGFLGDDGEVVLDQDVILEYLSDEQREQIDHIHQVCEIISDTFRVYGIPANDQRKAQTIYISYLVGVEEEDDFYIRLANCFVSANQWTSVYDLIGWEFGIVIPPEEQQKLDERYGVSGAP